MLKKFLVLTFALLLFCSPVLSFAENYQVVPYVGGSNSHNYFHYRSYSTTMSRRELISLKNEMRNEADMHDKVLALVSWLSSALDNGWIYGVPGSIIEDPARSSQHKIEDALDLNPNSRTFKVYYSEYRCEVPGAGYIKVTSVYGK